MILTDYTNIILEGIFNSPDFLVEHLKRELKKVNDMGYGEDEFEHDLKEVLTLMRNQIEDVYIHECKLYKTFRTQDQNLPKGEKRKYPKPTRETVSITNFKLPKERSFTLPEPVHFSHLDRVEAAWDELVHQNVTAVSKSRQNTVSVSFQLNERVLSKADYIRILNVLNELHAFKNEDGQYPAKKDTVENFGRLVGLDLKHYQKDLNKALDCSKEANLEIFDTLKRKAIELWETKNYK